MIDQLFERYDLTIAHSFLAMSGFFLAIYAMKLTEWEAEDHVDPWVVRLLRKCVYALLAWSFLWSLDVTATRFWQPWPAVLLMMLAIDGILLIRIIAIRARVHRTGVKPDAPRAVASKLTAHG